RPVPRTRPARRAASASVVALLALAGCGGGDDGTTPAATTAPVAADRSAALITAVCSAATKPVPPVPGPGTSAADGRTYVRAVATATATLASDLDRLASQEADRRDVLAELAARARGVNAVARRTRDGRSAGGAANDLAGAIARLNVAATRDRLPQCGL
ncbi:MAG: hypothetical protein Q7T67_08675, partial [Patulibacter sp.]